MTLQTHYALVHSDTLTDMYVYENFTQYRGEKIEITVSNSGFTNVRYQTSGEAWFVFDFTDFTLCEVWDVAEAILDGVTFVAHTSKRLSGIRALTAKLHDKFPTLCASTFYAGTKKDDAVIDLWSVWDK